MSPPWSVGRERVFFLASLPDGQDVLIRIGGEEEPALLGEALGRIPLSSNDG